MSNDPGYVIRADGTLMRATEIEREEHVSVENPPDTHRAFVLSAEIDHAKAIIRKYEGELADLEARLVAERMLHPEVWGSREEWRTAMRANIAEVQRRLRELRDEVGVKQAEHDRITG
jgi:hypothetical protein